MLCQQVTQGPFLMDGKSSHTWICNMWIVENWLIRLIHALRHLKSFPISILGDSSGWVLSVHDCSVSYCLWPMGLLQSQECQLCFWLAPLGWARILAFWIIFRVEEKLLAHSHVLTFVTFSFFGPTHIIGISWLGM